MTLYDPPKSCKIPASTDVCLQLRDPAPERPRQVARPSLQLPLDNSFSELFITLTRISHLSGSTAALIPKGHNENQN